MSTCPICTSKNTKTVAAYRFKSPIFSACSRNVCPECDMVFASPMPSEVALSAYNASYFSTAHGGQPKNSIAITFFSAIAGLRIDFVKRFLAKHHILVERVLEFGPGSGFFAKIWLEQSPGASYYAFETDGSCHESLKKYGVNIVQDADVGSVDLVVMSHVLEHVSNPVDFIQVATRDLKTGGVLFIEVPCRDWEHKSLDEPHILFFDKNPMSHLLDKTGFVDVEVSYFGRPISKLRYESWFYKKWMIIRAKLMSWGLLLPFLPRSSVELEILKSGLERAVIAPYFAHRESPEPAWWLRAIARKL